MYYQLRFKVEGDTVARSPYEINMDPYFIKVETNEQHFVTHLSIRKKVIDYIDFLPNLAMDPDKGHSLLILENPHHDDIVGLSQHIESLGSFRFRLRKIHWDFPQSQWIPENGEGKHAIMINKLEFSQKYDSSPSEMEPQILEQVINARDFYKDLVIPLSFMREGRNEFRSFRYINAFYNFYFYLEGLYGKGKTKNRQVEDAFKESKIVLGAIESTIKLFRNDSKGKHIKVLQEFLDMENCSFDARGIIDLIVAVRGNLHHFSPKSTKKKGHPLNHKDFETMAYLLMCICIHTFKSLGSKNK